MTREDMAKDLPPFIFTTNHPAQHFPDTVTRGDTVLHDQISPHPKQTLFSERGNVTRRDTLPHSLLSLPACSHSGIVTHGDTISPGLLSPIASLSSERVNVTRGDA